MVERFIERIDIYLVLLVLVTVYLLIISDPKYFHREDKARAKKQSIGIGVIMFVITIGLYIVREIFL